MKYIIVVIDLVPNLSQDLVLWPRGRLKLSVTKSVWVVLPYLYPEWSENVNHINLGNKQSGLDINATFLEDGYCTNRFHGLGSKIL